MGMLELRLFGGFELKTVAGHPVSIARKKAQALLAYLACHAGQAHPRDKLAAPLWPEIDDQQARANLRKARRRVGGDYSSARSSPTVIGP